jgi:hypothetical protein
MGTILAQLTLITGVLSLLLLLALHFASPEFGPGWRMVSEYALGRHNGVLLGFFVTWGMASLLLAAMLWGEVSGVWARIGVCLLVISAVGEVMGGVFDLRHKLHGLAFGIGVPSLPIAALLIGYHLAASEGWSAYGTAILAMSHATWVSVILMAAAMAVMITGFRKAGIVMGPGARPPEHVPPGVIALGGFANRLLVLCDVGWLMLIAWIYLLIR